MVWRGRLIQSHIKLREVKQLKETAVCESMHGGVRGRGSNPPTYSIVMHFWNWMRCWLGGFDFCRFRNGTMEKEVPSLFFFDSNKDFETGTLNEELLSVGWSVPDALTDYYSMLWGVKRGCILNWVFYESLCQSLMEILLVWGWNELNVRVQIERNKKTSHRKLVCTKSMGGFRLNMDLLTVWSFL